MKQISSISEIAALAAEARATRRPVALVPTMGCLHAGKQSMIRAAKIGAGDPLVVVSAFINPLQFGANELVARYPRDPARDAEIAEACGADALFAPLAEEILPRGFATAVNEDTLSRTLCGPSRPGHFRGVTTMTAKLLNIVRPHRVYFGQKTAQRAAVVRKTIADLAYDADVVVVDTAREPDGLAAGTANTSFTDSQRQEALALSRALRRAKEMSDSGTRSPDRIVAEATHILAQHRRIRTIYVSIVSMDTLEFTREVVPGRYMLALAAWVDETRLIDNIRL
ncbi:MAG TPA: pantoate--beta-alanine ligase [Opitutaceae bacterium]|jgi:pantoate--beta-alanine ligase